MTVVNQIRVEAANPEAGAGGVSVYEQQDSDHYKIIAQFDTKHGKTSEYVSLLHRSI